MITLLKKFKFSLLLAMVLHFDNMPLISSKALPSRESDLPSKLEVENIDRSESTPLFPVVFNSELKKMRNLNMQRAVAINGRMITPRVTTGEIFEALQRANRNIAYKLKSLMMKKLARDLAKKKKLAKLFSMSTQKIPIEFLESVLDQVEADPDVKKELSSENLDSEGEKMKEKIEEKLRAYRDLYFNILD